MSLYLMKDPFSMQDKVLQSAHTKFHKYNANKYIKINAKVPLLNEGKIRKTIFTEMIHNKVNGNEGNHNKKSHHNRIQRST